MSAKWILLAMVPHKGRELRLHFDGRKFTTKGKAKRFADAKGAAKVGRLIQKNFRDAVRGVRLRVQPLNAPNLSSFKKNPSGYRRAVDKYARELDQADELLDAFSGHRGREVLSVRERPIKTGLVVGELLGVMYATTRDGQKEKYVHEIRKQSRPLLVAAHDGSQIGFVGGRLRFTERGIEDA